MRTMKLASLALAMLCFSLLAATGAWADSTNFMYTASGNTFTWQLPTSPAPTAGNFQNGYFFELDNISFKENGVPMVGSFDFYNAIGDGGGFDLIVGGSTLLIDAYGLQQVYTGWESAPTFQNGSYSFLDLSGSPAYGKLKVSSTVPEPSALSLLAIGLVAGMALLAFKKN